MILHVERAIDKAIVILSIVVFSACQVQTVRHEPNIAVSDTNNFLKALYVDEDYATALGFVDVQLRQSLSAEDLRGLVAGIKQQRGKLKALRADSYLMTPGRTMELFYVGTYENGTIYHHLVLIGDLSTGYKVSGVWYSVDPYPKHPLRREFDQQVFVE